LDLPPVMRIWQDQVEVVTAPDGFAPEGCSYLLRPDGYVAARGSAANPGNLVSYLHLLFGTGGHASSLRLPDHRRDRSDRTSRA
jgi:hypothetical protein